MIDRCRSSEETAVSDRDESEKLLKDWVVGLPGGRRQNTLTILERHRDTSIEQVYRITRRVLRSGAIPFALGFIHPSPVHQVPLWVFELDHDYFAPGFSVYGLNLKVTRDAALRFAAGFSLCVRQNAGVAIRPKVLTLESLQSGTESGSSFLKQVWAPSKVALACRRLEQARFANWDSEERSLSVGLGTVSSHPEIQYLYEVLKIRAELPLAQILQSKEGLYVCRVGCVVAFSFVKLKAIRDVLLQLTAREFYPDLEQTGLLNAHETDYKAFISDRRLTQLLQARVKPADNKECLMPEYQKRKIWGINVWSEGDV
jgi:hypothetical protein